MLKSIEGNFDNYEVNELLIKHLLLKSTKFKILSPHVKIYPDWNVKQ